MEARWLPPVRKVGGWWHSLPMGPRQVIECLHSSASKAILNIRPQSSSPRTSNDNSHSWIQQPPLLEEPCSSPSNNHQNTLQLGGLGLAGPGRALALPKDGLSVSWGLTQRICVPWALLSTQWKMPGSRHGSLHFHRNLSQSRDWLWLLNWTRLDSCSEMSNGKMYQQPGSLSNMST